MEILFYKKTKLSGWDFRKNNTLENICKCFNHNYVAEKRGHNNRINCIEYCPIDKYRVRKNNCRCILFCVWYQIPPIKVGSTPLRNPPLPLNEWD